MPLMVQHHFPCLQLDRNVTVQLGRFYTLHLSMLAPRSLEVALKSWKAMALLPRLLDQNPDMITPQIINSSPLWNSSSLVRVIFPISFFSSSFFSLRQYRLYDVRYFRTFLRLFNDETWH